MPDSEFTLFMPSYNHERYIEEAIRSVHAQTEPFDRIVFFSDGSKDRTLEIARDLFGDDPRVTWLPELEVNKGVITRMQEVAARIPDGLMMGLSGDDVLKPRACEIFRALSRSRPFEWAIGATEITDQDLRPTSIIDPLAAGFSSDGSDVFTRLLRLRPWLPAQSWCFSAELLRRVGGYDSRFRVEDYSLGLRFALATRPILTSEVIAIWRRVDTALSFQYSEQMWADHARTALQFLADAPVTALAVASRHFREAHAGAMRRGHWASGVRYGLAALALWPSPHTVVSTARTFVGGTLRRFSS